MKFINCMPVHAKRERSLWSGTFILMSGGMKLLESSFTANIELSDQVAWYAGCMIGAFISEVGMRLVPKRFLFLIAGLLVTIGGIIAASSRQLSAIVASFWLDGLAFGMTVLLYIIVAAENCDRFKRGGMVAKESFAVSMGYLIFCIISTVHYLTTTTTTDSISIIQSQGISSIVLGLAACASTYFFIETPVYHLMKGDENEALNAVAAIELQSVDYEELKDYVQYDGSRTFQEHITYGLLPLAKITIVRVFMFITMVYPMTISYSFMSIHGFHTNYGILWFGLTRWIGTFFGAFFIIDKIGRKKTLAICALVSGILYIVIEVLMKEVESYFVPAASLILLTNLFLGMSQSVSSVYLSEAFPPSIKSIMIFIAICIENLVVIIVMAAMPRPTSFSLNYLVYGIFLILISIMTVTLLPETKHLSALKAMEKQQQFFNFGF